MSEHSPAPQQTGLTFPCRYPVKAMVHARPSAHYAVLETIAQHASFDHDQDVSLRPSRNGRFQSMTVTVAVDSREHLERIYAELHALEVVLMTL
jgi:putative lipoic acid-binding regulatory protein